MRVWMLGTAFLQTTMEAHGRHTADTAAGRAPAREPIAQTCVLGRPNEWMQPSHSDRVCVGARRLQPLAIISSGRPFQTAAFEGTMVKGIPTRGLQDTTWMSSGSDKPKHREAPKKCLSSRVTQPITPG